VSIGTTKRATGKRMERKVVKVNLRKRKEIKMETVMEKRPGHEI
jgi:hypothetical protein